jgi:hypothetical protein
MRIILPTTRPLRPVPQGAATEESLVPQGLNTSGRTEDSQGDTSNGKVDNSTLVLSVAQGSNASATTVQQKTASTMVANRKKRQ